MATKTKKTKSLKPVPVPTTKAHAVLQTMQGQAQASNETLVDRVRKTGGTVGDIVELCNRFEAMLLMCAKPQQYYRREFEVISETSHDEDEQRAAEQAEDEA